MSRRGNCWDNAVAESFFATLKKELVRNRPFGTREHARAEVFEYIEVFYNRCERTLSSTTRRLTNSNVAFEKRIVA